MKVTFAKETSAVSPTPTPEMVITEDATDVTSNSATLNGRVPIGTPAAYMYFEYGTTSGTYTSSVYAGRDDLTDKVSAKVSGLTPATIYYYRLVILQKPATSSGYVYGNEKSFITLEAAVTPIPTISPTPGFTLSPTSTVTPCGDISTDEATDVTSNSATLNATVCVGITAGQIYFEYGTTSGTYTSSIDARGDDLSNSVYARISGLSPATIYYYRIVVIQKGTPPPNPTEYTYGEEKSFTTLSDTTTPTPECEPKRMLVSSRKLRLKKGQSSEVTLTLDGDNCVPAGKTITATIGKFGSKLISISSKSGITDENGKATFTITAKENIGSTKVTFKVGSQKRAIIVRVRG